MIPRVARGSTSFGEAKDYYLHDKDGDVLDRDESSPMQQAGDYALNDKGGARTSHRVGFTETINLEATAPAEAIREMQDRYDAFRQQEHHKRGRKLQKPVYTYSLSWSPDEKPSRDEMMAAARSSLTAMRLDGLQTLVVQHLDEPQPHIHLIVHRIEADGKRARNIPWDHLRFSRWAEAYEREHGKVLCDQRARNNAQRDAGVFVKDEQSLPRRAYEALHRNGEQSDLRQPPKLETAKAVTAELFQRHVAEREALDRSYLQDASSRAKAARDALNGTWRTIYTRQDMTSRELRVANRGGILERAVFLYRHKPLLEQQGPLTSRQMMRLCLSAKVLDRAVRQAHRQERTDMARFEDSCAAKASGMALDEYRLQSRELVYRQSFERDLLVARVGMERQPLEMAASSAPQPVRVPDLRQGEMLAPDTLDKLLTDPMPLSEIFARNAVHSRPFGSGDSKQTPSRKPRRDDDFDHDR